MDDISEDEVTAIDTVGSRYLSSKESDYSLTPGSSDMLEYPEMIIPSEINDLESSPGLFPDFLDSKNIDRIGASEHASTSPHCVDESGDYVEELTLGNFNSGKAIAGNLSIREKVPTRNNQWQHLYQRAGGIRNGNLNVEGAYRDDVGEIPSGWEDEESTYFPGFWDKRAPVGSCNGNMDHSPINEHKSVPSTTLLSSGGIRTKILSKSGFSEYFVKNTLKGKGVICRSSSRDRLGVDIRGKGRAEVAGVAMVDSDVAQNTTRETLVRPSHGFPEPRPVPSADAFHDGASLREWLIAGQNKVNRVKSLYIFKQILDLVDLSHSREVALLELRPSYFKLLPSNQVVYLGSPKQKETVENVREQDSYFSGCDAGEKRLLETGIYSGASQYSNKRKIGDNAHKFRKWPQFPVRSGTKSGTPYETSATISGAQDFRNVFNEEHMVQSKYSSPHASSASQIISSFARDPLEEKWYSSPEELRERCCTLSSNIYSLGILLFELLGTFGSERAHAVAMVDLHHRILPPTFLSENHKEAGLILWLLHPEPSSRPSSREILQSEVIRGIHELSGGELSPSIKQDDGDSELLSHFLVTLKEQKEKDASKLVKYIKCLESDIAEVEKRRKKLFPVPCNDKSLDASGNSSIHEDIQTFRVNLSSSPSCLSDSRLSRNMSQLERAYFSGRSELQLSDSDMAAPANLEFLGNQETLNGPLKIGEHKSTDRLGAFFHGLCKYARYSKFEVRGIVRNDDFNSSANVICSLSFDRDEDYFATAGVLKKIKVYEYNALLTDSVDVHYPAIEMSNKSRLSCICWNSYIRNYLASTDYDGVVKIWDVGSGEEVSHHSEHETRAWSVDFSQVDPTKFVSGSDDCSVKLWSISEKNSLSTIRNIANVCCVQFSPYSTHLLSFGSADYKTYCFDLRNASRPLCILAGHEKAVSYVKFLDSETIVSASTDNTLKLWDLNKTNSGGLSTDACISTFTGHTNEKNFVGLSVADGYITCGSETNEVFSYYRSLPMPITSHKFGSIDPISGKEVENDNNQFVSSVCWRRKSDTVVAANSTGCIKLLQMV